MILRAQGVGKVFNQGDDRLEILHDISLELREPKTVAIMGRSGCGKSTLISLLAGLDAPTVGTIEVLGKNLAALSSAGLNSFRALHIGIVFQQFHLLEHLTAFENVRLPLDFGCIEGRLEKPDERAREMLEKVGLGHRLNHLPDQLSRGECQRVAIARVLVTKPELLLADEPTGSLDVKTGREIMDMIFSLVSSEKLALVMATHDPAVAERCQEKLFMAAGRLGSAPPPP